MIEIPETDLPGLQEVIRNEEPPKIKELQEKKQRPRIVGGNKISPDKDEIGKVRQLLKEEEERQTAQADPDLTEKQERLYGGTYAEIAEDRYGKGLLARHGDLAIREIGEISSDDRVVEVGCNTGMLLGQLKERGIEAIGIDINKAALKKAKEKGHKVVPANAEHLPLEDGSINILISLHTYEHVEDLEQAFSEIGRVLASGGKAIIIVPLNLGGLETIKVAIEDMPSEKRGKGRLAFIKDFLNGIKYARRLHCSTLGGPFGGARKHAERICEEKNIGIDVSGGVRPDLGFANLLILKKPEE